MKEGWREGEGGMEGRGIEGKVIEWDRTRGGGGGGGWGKNGEGEKGWGEGGRALGMVGVVWGVEGWGYVIMGAWKR